MFIRVDAGVDESHAQHRGQDHDALHGFHDEQRLAGFAAKISRQDKQLAGFPLVFICLLASFALLVEEWEGSMENASCVTVKDDLKFERKSKRENNSNAYIYSSLLLLLLVVTVMVEVGKLQGGKEEEKGDG